MTGVERCPWCGEPGARYARNHACVFQVAPPDATPNVPVTREPACAEGCWAIRNGVRPRSCAPSTCELAISLDAAMPKVWHR